MAIYCFYLIKPCNERSCILCLLGPGEGVKTLVLPNPILVVTGTSESNTCKIKSTNIVSIYSIRCECQDSSLPSWASMAISSMLKDMELEAVVHLKCLKRVDDDDDDGWGFSVPFSNFSDISGQPLVYLFCSMIYNLWGWKR